MSVGRASLSHVEGQSRSRFFSAPGSFVSYHLELYFPPHDRTLEPIPTTSQITAKCRVAFRLSRAYASKAATSGNLVPKEDLKIDFSALSIEGASLNGRSFDVLAGWKSGKLALPSTYLTWDLSSENILLLEYTIRSANSGSSIRRIVDPLTKEIIYYTDFKPFDAYGLFPCFDQPDIDTVFSLSVTAPNDWVAVANTPLLGKRPSEGSTMWSFQATRPIATSSIGLALGNFQSLRVMEQQAKANVSIYHRKNMSGSPILNKVAIATSQALSFFGEYFSVSSPFEKLDVVIVAHATHPYKTNDGLIIFNENVFHAEDPTSLDKRISEYVYRAVVRLWIGVIVRFNWWDLWLNQAIVTVLSYIGLEETHTLPNIWQQFTSKVKPRAFLDEPLAYSSNYPDASQVTFKYDVLSDAKGAAVFYQLYHILSKPVFRQIFSELCQQYMFRCVSTEAILGIFENHFVFDTVDGDSVDFRSWWDCWMYTEGINMISLSIDVDSSHHIKSLEIQQQGDVVRPHYLRLALFEEENGMGLFSVIMDPISLAYTLKNYNKIVHRQTKYMVASILHDLSGNGDSNTFMHDNEADNHTPEKSTLSNIPTLKHDSESKSNHGSSALHSIVSAKYEASHIDFPSPALISNVLDSHKRDTIAQEISRGGVDGPSHWAQTIDSESGTDSDREPDSGSDGESRPVSKLVRTDGAYKPSSSAEDNTDTHTSENDSAISSDFETDKSSDYQSSSKNDEHEVEVEDAGGSEHSTIFEDSSSYSSSLGSESMDDIVLYSSENQAKGEKDRTRSFDELVPTLNLGHVRVHTTKEHQPISDQTLTSGQSNAVEQKRGLTRLASSVYNTKEHEVPIPNSRNHYDSPSHSYQNTNPNRGMSQGLGDHIDPSIPQSQPETVTQHIQIPFISLDSSTPSNKEKEADVKSRVQTFSWARQKIDRISFVKEFELSRPFHVSLLPETSLIWTTYLKEQLATLQDSVHRGIMSAVDDQTKRLFEIDRSWIHRDGYTTPLHITATMNFLEVAQFLRGIGASLLLRDAGHFKIEGRMMLKEHFTHKLEYPRMGDGSFQQQQDAYSNSNNDDGGTAHKSESRHIPSSNSAVQTSKSEPSKKLGGFTPIHMAAHEGHTVWLTQICHHLTQAGIHDVVFATSQAGWRAIHLAAFMGRTSTVRYLLELGCLANGFRHKLQGNQGLQQVAAASKWPSEFNQGVNYSSASPGDTSQGNTPRYDNTLGSKSVQLCIEIDIGPEGWTPLLLASMSGHADTVRAILDFGVDTYGYEWIARQSGMQSGSKNALEWAAFLGWTDVVQIFVEYRWPLSNRAPGRTQSHPLLWACRGGDIEVVKILLRAGADPLLPACVDEGQPLLHGLISAAAGLRMTQLQSQWRGQGQEIRQTLRVAANEANTILSLVCQELHQLACSSPVKYAKCLEALNAIDGYGWTPLHWATYGGYANADAIKMLLRSGVETDSKDALGWTPLMVLLASFLNPGMLQQRNRKEQNGDGNESVMDDRSKRRDVIVSIWEMNDTIRQALVPIVIELSEEILRAGANPNNTSGYGLSPLDIVKQSAIAGAPRCVWQPMTAVLLKYGANRPQTRSYVVTEGSESGYNPTYVTNRASSDAVISKDVHERASMKEPVIPLRREASAIQLGNTQSRAYEPPLRNMPFFSGAKEQTHQGTSSPWKTGFASPAAAVLPSPKVDFDWGHRKSAANLQPQSNAGFGLTKSWSYSSASSMSGHRSLSSGSNPHREQQDTTNFLSNKGPGGSSISFGRPRSGDYLYATIRMAPPKTGK